MSGKIDNKARTLTQGASDLNRATVGVHNFTGDIQTQAQPSKVHQRRDPLKTLEQFALIFFGYSNPHVLHLKTRAAVLRRDRYFDRLAGSKLHRIRQQVADDSLNLFAISFSDHRRVRMNVERAMGLLRLFAVPL